jgi:transposase
MLTDLLFPHLSDIEVNEVSVDHDVIRVRITTTAASVACPHCGETSGRVHSRYQRTVQDLPWVGRVVQMQCGVRRFFCPNVNCAQKTFSEPLAPLISKYSRRTLRLHEQLQQIALRLGGQGGQRLAVKLGLPTSASTLLRLIFRIAVPASATPCVLGIDDWAQRKGQSYGTILVDLEKRRIVEILPDRTTETVAQWLLDHPGVETVSRDRAEAYAAAIRQGAPEAVQVADRWHLLKNMSETLAKVLQPFQTTLQRQLLPTESAVEAPSSALPTQAHAADDHEAGASCAANPEQPERFSAADERRQDRAATAHRLHQQGWTSKAIAAQLHLHPKTVRRYLQMALPLAPLRRTRRRLLDPYRPYLLERWNAGCHNATHLLREIQAQGFAGKASSVRAFVAHLRQLSGIPPRVRSAQGQPVSAAQTKRPPTLRRLIGWIMQRPDQLSASQQLAVAQVQTLHPQLETTIELAQSFATIVRQQRVDRFDAWLDKAAACAIVAFQTFALELRQDAAAVRAALSLPWSNGPTEGHINRLKTVKRQMYGRGSLDLLRRRLLCAA